MKYKILKLSILSTLLFLFSPSEANSTILILTADGKIAIVGFIDKCSDVGEFRDGLRCFDLITPNEPTVSDPGVRPRKWRKSAKENSLRLGYSSAKIRRMKVKVLDGKKRMYYRKWFLGKKQYVLAKN